MYRARRKSKKGKGGGGGQARPAAAPRGPGRPQVIVVGGPPAAAPKPRPRAQSSGGGNGKTVRVMKQTVGSLLGGALGGGGVYANTRLVEEEKHRVMVDGGIALLGLATEVGGAMTNSPMISHAGAAMHGAGLGGIAADVGTRHRREAAAKPKDKPAAKGVAGPVDRIRQLIQLLARRLNREGVDSEEIAGYCTEVGQAHQAGRLHAGALQDAINLLDADDLNAALATLSGASLDQVDVAGPREWIRKRMQKRDENKAERANEKLLDAGVNQVTHELNLQSLTNPAIQARIDQVLAQ